MKISLTLLLIYIYIYILQGIVCNPGLTALLIHQTEWKVFKKGPIDIVNFLFCFGDVERGIFVVCERLGLCAS